MLFDKGAKAIKWGKEVFQQMFLEKLDIPMQRMKLKPYPPPYRKVDSKWAKSLNIRMSITKLSEENRGKKVFFKTKNIKKEKKIGQILHNIGFGNNFLDMTPKVQAKEKNEHI